MEESVGKVDGEGKHGERERVDRVANHSTI